MRTIPGMVVLNPADHYEMTEAVKAAYAYQGPVYIRLGRLAIDSFNDPETYHFELGKGITLKEGTDVTVIATGPIVLLYPFLQKYFVKGLTLGAVKG